MVSLAKGRNDEDCNSNNDDDCRCGWEGGASGRWRRLPMSDEESQE